MARDKSGGELRRVSARQVELLCFERKTIVVDQEEEGERVEFEKGGAATFHRGSNNCEKVGTMLSNCSNETPSR